MERVKEAEMRGLIQGGRWGGRGRFAAAVDVGWCWCRYCLVRAQEMMSMFPRDFWVGEGEAAGAMGGRRWCRCGLARAAAWGLGRW